MLQGYFYGHLRYWLRKSVGLIFKLSALYIQLCTKQYFIMSILDKKLSQYVDFMKKNYPPGFTYQDFAHDFTAEFYNPDEWAEIFQSSGAKYSISSYTATPDNKRWESMM